MSLTDEQNREFAKQKNKPRLSGEQGAGGNKGAHGFQLLMNHIERDQAISDKQHRVGRHSPKAVKTEQLRNRPTQIQTV